MDYRATLNLPVTEFPMRANLAQREPELLKKWDQENLYARIQEHSAVRPPYILHDGPPYANGNIHLGTAFNKVLKDIILKSRRLAGFHCPYVPGWDCHGLPIEHNVDRELKAKKKDLPKLAIRGACRRYAEKWIITQKKEFQRLGVLGDWDNPYLTLDFAYEAAIAREFNRFLLNGSVVRSKKPVYWCSSCHTALAEAEVEYQDHGSPSIFVRFALEDGLGDLVPEVGARTVSMVIWTTTPWTLPANLAVAIHPDLTYVVVEAGGELMVVAEARLDGFLAETSLETKGDEQGVVARVQASDLVGRFCRHPFMEREAKVIFADYVTTDTGSGCVHIAPGHGREDYISGLANDLPVLSPVDDTGRFTDEAGPYAGMLITEANRPICDDLAKTGALVHESTLSHSYPHCWRCKNPVIFRATKQWFISMEENDLRARALDAIRTVKWTPAWGMDRIFGMVESRPDWCLSRQRTWGVPITVFVCNECGEILKDEKVIAKIDAFFRAEGADAWFSHPVEDFLGPDSRCAQCGGTAFDREEDILDVWFDSGVSHAAVLEERSGLSSPADLYLEGSDQHRGWFQSSLLTSVGTRGRAPFKGVLTHGFVVDGQGKKMSKSIGNVIAPEEVIKKYGAEILRLWVASEDYREDIKVSDEILKHLSDSYRKIRNTIRFLLGNLADFIPAEHTVAPQGMEELDRWVLASFERLKQTVAGAYDRFEFHAVYHQLVHFCGVTLSALYLDIIKDRLYVSHAEDGARRAAQTVLHHILDGLVRLLAPVLSFTAEEAWSYLPAATTGDPRPASVFLADFQPTRQELLDQELLARWDRLLVVRSAVTRALEQARRDKVIGHPLEAAVRLHVTGEYAAFLADKWQLLQTVSIVSSLQQVDAVPENAVTFAEQPDLAIAVTPALGKKCDRCWTRSETVGQNADHPAICRRCADVVARLG